MEYFDSENIDKLLEICKIHQYFPIKILQNFDGVTKILRGRVVRKTITVINNTSGKNHDKYEFKSSIDTIQSYLFNNCHGNICSTILHGAIMSSIAW